MRNSSLARRSVATLSVTALLTAAGFTSGLTVGAANAQTVTSVQRQGGGEPTAVNNATVNFQVNGSEFMPADQQDVILRPSFTATGQGDITGTVQSTGTCSMIGPITPPDADCSGPLIFSAPLTGVAPGQYQVIVTQTSVNPSNEPEIDPVPGSVTVLSVGPAAATEVGANGTTPGALTITGTNIFRGARVVFYRTENGVATTPDEGLVFTPTSYAPSTRVDGTYTANGSQADGLHIVRVFNVDQPSSPGTGPAFVQPRITSISPSTLGQGATAVPVTVTGGGFDSNTTASYSDANVSVASAPTATNSTTLVIPTSVAPATTLGTKSLTLRGTGGAFATATNVLTVTEKPTVTANVPTRGQGSSGVVTITGTGFNATTDFDLGPGVTTTTESATATAAQVLVVVSPDAAATTRDVKATNGDFGTSTRAAAFTVAPKPVITKISPASADRGENQFVTITGDNLPASGSASITVSGGDVTVTGVSGNGGNPGTLQAFFNVGPNAAFGPRDVTIVNTSHGGASACDDCFGVNSLTVTPAGSTNAVDSDLRSITVNGDGLTASSVITLSLPGNPDYQPTITGTGTSAPASDGSLTRQFNLASAATGDYTVTATTGEATPLVCIACFKVASAAPPVVTSIAPSTAGQGAVNRTGVITGSNFSRGENVTFTGSGITVNSVTWNTPTQLTISYDVAEDAAVGPRGVTVTNIGDGASGTSANTAFTVTAGPKITTISRNRLGQGANAVPVTITGTGFADGVQVSFGPGTTTTLATGGRTDTALNVLVSVAGDAVTTNLRDVRVTNTDGGSSVQVGAVTITPAPVIAAISPSSMKPGTTNNAVTITGTGFAKQTTGGETPTTTFPTLIIPGVTANVTAVAENGSSMTATFTVPANAAIAARSVRVINPDKGESTKTGAFAVAFPAPSTPTAVKASAGDARVFVSWAASNGQGTAITGYVVRTTLADGTLVKDTNAAGTSAIITGLTNATPYKFTVLAKSSGGQSAPSAAVSATPRFSTKLTSTRSVATPVAGQGVTFSGVLTRRSSGARIAGATIFLTVDPEFGATRTVRLTTNSVGVWSTRQGHVYNSRVFTSYSGSFRHFRTTAPNTTMFVAPRITRTSPANGSSSSAGSVLLVKGTVAPNKAGRTVVLYSGTKPIASAKVASDSTFSIPSRLARGSYRLSVAIGKSPGNVFGRSASFSITRT